MDVLPGASGECHGPTASPIFNSSQVARLATAGRAAVNALSLSRRLTIVHPMEIAVPATSDDDELTALVGRVRGGNADAFEALANRVRLRIRRWAHRLVRDGDEAEDVAQMVLVRMHERLDEFEGRSRFGSWLYRITRNVALDRRRVEERRHALLECELRSRGTSITTESETDAGDAARIAHLVTSYFSTLPPRQRDVFELIELRGMPTADVARRLGIEPPTVRVLLLRARRTIRTRMLTNHPDLVKEHRS